MTLFEPGPQPAPRPWLPSLPWAAIAVLFLLFQWHPWFGPDIWYHLYLGGRIAATGSAQPTDGLILQQPGYINLYWLFQLLARGLYGLGGIPAVSALFAAVWAVAGACWARTAGVLRAGSWGPLAALAALLVCQTRFEERPEVFSYAFLALQLHWLVIWPADRAARPRDYGRFILVEALWANTHGYFIFGPALVALRWAASALEPAAPGKAPARKTLGLLFALTLLASVASPFGIGTWREALVLARFLRQMHGWIQEFVPPWRVPADLWSLKVFALWLGGAVASAAAALAIQGRRAVFAAGCAGLGIALSLVAYRNVPLAVFLAGPALGMALPRLARFALPRIMPIAIALAAGAESAAVASGAFYRSTGGMPGFGMGESAYGSPTLFADYLRTRGFHGSVFNDATDGGYLEFHFPGLQPYSDSRFVDAGPVLAYFSALRDPGAFRALDGKHRFEAVLLRVGESPHVTTALLRDPQWTLAYADLRRAFFTRGPQSGGSPGGALRFYAGEDLTLPMNGFYASMWVAILAEAGDSERLLLAVRQFGKSAGFPAVAAGIAMDYGRQRSDPRIISAAAGLAAGARP